MKLTEHKYSKLFPGYNELLGKIDQTLFCKSLPGEKSEII